MDPSAYARAYGVQSEANRVTVTRVAANEITYRRAVDCYRKRMSSTMTHIRREQRKLKHNMRDYRKKLRGDLPPPKPYKAGWIANDSYTNLNYLPLLDKRHDASNDSVKKSFENTKTSPGQFHDTVDTGTKPHKESRLQAQVNTFLKSVDDHVNSVYSFKKPETESNDDEVFLYDKNGRRRFLFGPGELRTAHVSRDIESDTDDHHDLLPDSSDDEDSPQSESNKKDTQDNYKAKRPRGLVRLGSVYFKAIDKEADDAAPTVDGDKESDVDKEEAGKGNGECSNDDSAGNAGLGQQDANGSTLTEEGKNAADVLGERVKELQAELDSAQTGHSNPKINDSQETELSHGRKPPRRNSKKLNFGQLIKFQHGLNTKKLFSMVDQLASKYGILSTEEKNDQSSKGTKDRNESPKETKTSIFYAMKYGYGKLNDVSEMDESTIAEDLSQRLASTHIDSDSRNTQTHTDTQSFRPDSDRSDPPDGDFVDGTTRFHDGKSQKLLLPPIANSMSLASPSVNGTPKTLGRRSIQKHSNADVLSPINGPDFNSDVHHYNYRHDNASGARRNSFMSSEKKRKWLRNENLSKSVRRPELSVGRGKQVVSEHQRAAEGKKIAWSSALGRMKLIHTLVDLTHFI